MNKNQKIVENCENISDDIYCRTCEARKDCYLIESIKAAAKIEDRQYEYIYGPRDIF